MAQQVLTIAGQVVGSQFGPIGSAIGGQIGSMLGGALDGGNAPSLTDRKVQISSYGAHIGRWYGTVAGAGNVVWADELGERTSGGGKGGPVTPETVEGLATFFTLLTANEARGVRRAWGNDVLVHDTRLTIDNPSAVGLDITFYHGTQDQLPDPTMEAALGVGNVPAYRGRSAVTVRSMPLGQFGNTLPSMTWEVVGAGTFRADYARTSMGASHPNNWEFMRFRADGQLILVDRTSSPTLNVAIADGQTGVITLQVALSIGAVTNTDVQDVIYVPPTNEIWFVGKQASSVMIWRVDGASLALLEEVVADHGGASPPGNFGLVGYYEAAAQAVNVLRVSSHFSFCFRQYDLRGVLVGEPTTLPINYARWLIGGGAFVCLGSGYESGATSQQRVVAIQPVGVETSDLLLGGDVVDITYTGQGVPLAVQDVGDGAVAAWDGTRKRYCIIDRDGNYWTLADDAAPVFVAGGSITGTSTGFSTSATMIYVAGLDAFVYLTNSGLMHVLDAGTLDVIQFGISGPSGGIYPTLRPSPVDPGAVLVAGGGTGADVLYEKPLYATTVGDTVADLCLDAGMSLDSFDVSELPMRLRGFRVSNPGPYRSAIEQLAAMFGFDPAEEDDKLVFKLRGREPVLTVLSSDCIVDNADERPVNITRAEELSLPRRLMLTAPDPYTDYQPGTQSAERQAMNAGEDRPVSVDVVLTATENKRIADALLFDAWASRETAQTRLTMAAVRATCADVIILDGRRWRITSRVLEEWSIAVDLVADDQDVYQQFAPGVQGNFAGQTVRIIVNSNLLLLDLPLLRDAENDSGQYWAAWGLAPHYRGTLLYTSDDGGVSWRSLGTMPQPGTGIGTALSVLGGWDGGWLTDERNSLTVRWENGAPVSVTDAQLIGGANPLAVRSGTDWEIINYRSATVNVDGSYTLRGLIRGQRGTEYAMAGHAVGDQCVMLTPATIRDMELDPAHLGVPRQYKAASVGQVLDDVPVQTNTANAERLKPFSPQVLTIGRNGAGDAAIKWHRRTRLATRFSGAGGIFVPLGEATEAYEVEIWDAGFATLKRTITGLVTAEANYNAAAQVTDFGAVQNPIYTKVYQMSAAVGRGHELRGAA